MRRAEMIAVLPGVEMKGWRVKENYRQLNTVAVNPGAGLVLLGLRTVPDFAAGLGGTGSSAAGPPEAQPGLCLLDQEAAWHLWD